MKPLGAGRMTHDDGQLPAWRRAIGWTVRAAMGPQGPYSGLVAVRCRFCVHPKRRGDCPDIDKLCRAVLDSLTGVAYLDDKQVARLEASRSLDCESAEGLALTLEPLELPAEVLEPSPFAPEAKAKQPGMSKEKTWF